MSIVAAGMQSLGCRVTYDNAEAVAGSDVTVLAVKPNVIHKVLRDVREHVTSDGPLIASIAMGESILRVCEA